VRDHLERTGWNKRPLAPALPEDVVRKTSEKYIDAYTRLTGLELLPIAAPGKENRAS